MTQTQPEYGTNHAIYVLVLIIIILAGATSYLYYQKLQLESGSSSSYIVDYKNSAVLDKDKPVSLAVSGRVTLDYQTPRPGYIVIEFTSTQPTVITVGSSFVSGLYSRYPVDSIAGVSNASFSVPVFPGDTSITLINNHLLLTSQVVITVTYYG